MKLLMSARNGQREKPFKADLFLHPRRAAETGQGRPSFCPLAPQRKIKCKGGSLQFPS